MQNAHQKKSLSECEGFIMSILSGVASMPQIPRLYAEFSIFDPLLSFRTKTKSDFART